MNYPFKRLICCKSKWRIHKWPTKTQPGLYDLPITWPSFVCCWTPQLLLVPKSEFDAFLHVFATERWARHFQVAGPLSSKRLLLGKWVVLCLTINCPIKLTWIVLPWIYDFIITTIPGFFCLCPWKSQSSQSQKVHLLHGSHIHGFILWYIC